MASSRLSRRRSTVGASSSGPTAAPSNFTAQNGHLLEDSPPSTPQTTTRRSAISAPQTNMATGSPPVNSSRRKSRASTSVVAGSGTLANARNHSVDSSEETSKGGHSLRRRRTLEDKEKDTPTYRTRTATGHVPKTKKRMVDESADEDDVQLKRRVTPVTNSAHATPRKNPSRGARKQPKSAMWVDTDTSGDSAHDDDKTHELVDHHREKTRGEDEEEEQEDREEDGIQEEDQETLEAEKGATKGKGKVRPQEIETRRSTRVRKPTRIGPIVAPAPKPVAAKTRTGKRRGRPPRNKQPEPSSESDSEDAKAQSEAESEVDISILPHLHPDINDEGKLPKYSARITSFLPLDPASGKPLGDLKDQARMYRDSVQYYAKEPALDVITTDKDGEKQLYRSELSLLPTGDRVFRASDPLRNLDGSIKAKYLRLSTFSAGSLAPKGSSADRGSGSFASKTPSHPFQKSLASDFNRCPLTVAEKYWRSEKEAGGRLLHLHKLTPPTDSKMIDVKKPYLTWEPYVAGQWTHHPESRLPEPESEDEVDEEMDEEEEEAAVEEDDGSVEPSLQNHTEPLASRAVSDDTAADTAPATPEVPAVEKYQFYKMKALADITDITDVLANHAEMDYETLVGIIDRVAELASHYQNEYVALQALVDDWDNAQRRQADDAHIDRHADRHPSKDFVIKGYRAAPMGMKEKWVHEVRLQDKLMADVYFFRHDGHVSKQGRQDPIGQPHEAAPYGGSRRSLRNDPHKTMKGHDHDPNIVHGKRTRKPREPYEAGIINGASRSATPALQQAKRRGRRIEEVPEVETRPQTPVREATPEANPRKRRRGKNSLAVDSPLATPHNAGTPAPEEELETTQNTPVKDKKENKEKASKLARREELEPPAEEGEPPRKKRVRRTKAQMAADRAAEAAQKEREKQEAEDASTTTADQDMVMVDADEQEMEKSRILHLNVPNLRDVRGATTTPTHTPAKRGRKSNKEKERERLAAAALTASQVILAADSSATTISQPNSEFPSRSNSVVGRGRLPSTPQYSSAPATPTPPTFGPNQGIQGPPSVCPSQETVPPPPNHNGQIMWNAHSDKPVRRDSTRSRGRGRGRGRGASTSMPRTQRDSQSVMQIGNSSMANNNVTNALGLMPNINSHYPVQISQPESHSSQPPPQQRQHSYPPPPSNNSQQLPPPPLTTTPPQSSLLPPPQQLAYAQHPGHMGPPPSPSAQQHLPPTHSHQMPGQQRIHMPPHTTPHTMHSIPAPQHHMPPMQHIHHHGHMPPPSQYTPMQYQPPFIQHVPGTMHPTGPPGGGESSVRIKMVKPNQKPINLDNVVMGSKEYAQMTKSEKMSHSMKNRWKSGSMQGAVDKRKATLARKKQDREVHDPPLHTTIPGPDGQPTYLSHSTNGQMGPPIHMRTSGMGGHPHGVFLTQPPPYVRQIDRERKRDQERAEAAVPTQESGMGRMKLARFSNN